MDVAAHHTTSATAHNTRLPRPTIRLPEVQTVICIEATVKSAQIDSILFYTAAVLRSEQGQSNGGPMPPLTIRAAAERLGVGYSTFKRWVHTGRVRTIRTEGGYHRVSEAEVGRLAAHQQPDAPPRHRASEDDEGLAGLSARNRLHGFVVDDDADGRELVAATLEDYGAGVMTAASAAEALDVLQKKRVNVLLADIAMPDEDGYSLIRKLRALPSPQRAAIPAAALTSFAREEDRQHAIQAGFQLHLAKPIDTQSLVQAIVNLARGIPSQNRLSRTGRSVLR